MIEQATDGNFTIRRVHQAPRNLVFACMTTPEHLTHFWGPTGTRTPIDSIVLELRPGGAFETTMVNDHSGETHTMRAIYVAVEAPRHLSWREVDSGVVTELTFSDLGDGTTEVMTTQRGLPPHMRTPEARAGWGTALDRYAAYVTVLGRGRTTSTRLLVTGAIAGPFFVVSALVQAVARNGFDLAQHPPSALTLGSTGWVQVLTFVLAGLGFVAGALGLRRSTAGRKGGLAPVLIGVFGLALMAGGVFRMDPAFGFPPGTPDGVGETVSWHAAIHGFLFPLGFLSILAADWSLSRRYAAQERTMMRWTAVIVGPLAIGLSVWPNIGGDPQGRFWPLWLGVAVAFTAVSWALFDARPRSSDPSPHSTSRRTP